MRNQARGTRGCEGTKLRRQAPGKRNFRAQHPGSDAQVRGAPGPLHGGGPGSRERGGRRGGQKSFPAAVAVAVALAVPRKSPPRGPQLRTYPAPAVRNRDGDGCGSGWGRCAPGLQPPPPPPPPRPRPRPAPPIGCRATGPRLPRPISAEQRLLETFFPGPGRGMATRRPWAGWREGPWEAPAAGQGSGPPWRLKGAPWTPGGRAGICGPRTSRKYDSLPLTPVAFSCSWLFPKADRTKI